LEMDEALISEINIRCRSIGESTISVISQREFIESIKNG
jgi:hypothetical protein